MEYDNKCSLYLHQENQQSTLHRGAAQKFAKSSVRLPAFSRCIKRVLEVYFRSLEFHHAWTKKSESLINS